MGRKLHYMEKRVGQRRIESLAKCTYTEDMFHWLDSGLPYMTSRIGWVKKYRELFELMGLKV